MLQLCFENCCSRFNKKNVCLNQCVRSQSVIGTFRKWNLLKKRDGLGMRKWRNPNETFAINTFYYILSNRYVPPVNFLCFKCLVVYMYCLFFLWFIFYSKDHFCDVFLVHLLRVYFVSNLHPSHVIPNWT